MRHVCLSSIPKMSAILVVALASFVASCAGQPGTALSLPFAAIPLLNASLVNHFCLVSRDFNATAHAYAFLFGGSPPVGKPALHQWNWYRGANTSAAALLVHAPAGPPGFTVEIISPQDSLPSIYNELLGKQGPTVQHFGVAVPQGSMDAVRAQFEAAGYHTVQAGQGSWGCYAYIQMPDLGTIVELLDSGNMHCTCPT